MGGITISNSNEKKKSPNCNEIDKSAKTNLKNEIKPPKVSKLLKFKRSTTFLSNYEFNIKVCPNCSSKLLTKDLFCYNCGVDVVNIEKFIPKPKKPKISKLLKFKRNTTFLANYDFNLKSCPKCNSKLLQKDSFCYNCGNKI